MIVHDLETLALSYENSRLRRENEAFLAATIGDLSTMSAADRPIEWLAILQIGLVETLRR